MVTRSTGTILVANRNTDIAGRSCAPEDDSLLEGALIERGHVRRGRRLLQSLATKREASPRDLHVTVPYNKDKAYAPQRDGHGELCTG